MKPWPGEYRYRGKWQSVFADFRNGIREINPVDGAVVHEYEKGKPQIKYVCDF